ncbi:MAG: ABC transporter substrate-binding protein, partial [Deltaproteobacteria bacterium]|nr:ABC transporter substrate-binding protein [Deltaproteobacteria bacterium]
MKIRRNVVAVALTVVCVLLLAVDSSAGSPGFDDKEIRIAQWGPQTGPAAPWGSVARGPSVLFDLVNEE